MLYFYKKGKQPVHVHEELPDFVFDKKHIKWHIFVIVHINSIEVRLLNSFNVCFGRVININQGSKPFRPKLHGTKQYFIFRDIMSWIVLSVHAFVIHTCETYFKASKLSYKCICKKRYINPFIPFFAASKKCGRNYNLQHFCLKFQLQPQLNQGHKKLQFRGAYNLSYLSGTLMPR